MGRSPGDGHRPKEKKKKKTRKKQLVNFLSKEEEPRKHGDMIVFQD